MGFQKNVLVIVLCLLSCESKSYSNYPLFMGIPANSRELEFYKNLTEVYDVIYWRPPGGFYGAVEFTINPNQLRDFHNYTQYNGISLSLVMVDLQSAFDKQTVNTYTPNKPDTFNWNGFYRIDAIYNWLEDLQSSNPRILTLERIGMSTEKRFIYAVKLQYPNYDLGMRPKVVIEGGIHGREWISPAFVTYLINELVNAQSSQNKELRKIAKAYEWILVPVLNPDGYEYSHTHDRLWRKNRRFNQGVDLNRNFGIAFGTSEVNPRTSSDTYCGEFEFSEPETRAMGHLLEHNRDNLMYYLAFHSYGQRFIIPYSFTHVHFENYDEVKLKAEKAMARLEKKYGTEYSVGTAFETIGYLVSGDSACWAKKLFDIPYVGTMQLRDGGFYGFALPPDQIVPTCLETMEALYSFLDADTLESRVRPYPRNISGIVEVIKLHQMNQGRSMTPEVAIIFLYLKRWLESNLIVGDPCDLDYPVDLPLILKRKMSGPSSNHPAVWSIIQDSRPKPCWYTYNSDGRLHCAPCGRLFLNKSAFTCHTRMLLNSQR